MLLGFGTDQPGMQGRFILRSQSEFSVTFFIIKVINKYFFDVDKFMFNGYVIAEAARR